MMNLWDPKTIHQIMAMFGLRFHKEFGQNFLTDAMVIEDIADACAEAEACTVLEVGPGIGVLTRALAERYRTVKALEIDRNLIPVLKYTLGEFDNVTVYNEDVMQADLQALLAEDFQKGPVSVCANLPYYITSPILMKLLESRLPFESITVMVQEEVADRICAPAGGKAYGAITASVNYYGHAEKLFRVPADRFVPAPKVNSAVIRITLWKEKPCSPKSEEMLFRTIKAAFGQRRKTLANALSSGFPALTSEQIRQAVAQVSEDPLIRGERLDIAAFTQLSDILLEMLGVN
ncbi:MAG: 16S rRNA (adenine(1518)-N(6)/adenine(1519)-N(6))-dimethyltransferase RsmA [Ruminococcaceae bacterium]|nr:16S rRNA (adenine(1518)-N(6)/adenine(1519)-N(6))-dimethyltransferase RsmA [Oscillospiraceae bacterium]